MSVAQAEAAVQRWLDALHGRGDAAATLLAVTEDVVIERYGFGRQTGALVQRLEGPDEVNPWLTLTPPPVVFTQDSPVALAADGAFEVRYHLTALEYTGSGLWRMWLAADGRIQRLVHVPDNLPDAMEEADGHHHHSHSHSHSDSHGHGHGHD